MYLIAAQSGLQKTAMRMLRRYSMNLVYTGKTKNVYDMGDGNYMLEFKDDVTGTDGVFDPGANTVGLSIEGMGKICVKLTDFFFAKVAEAGIPTHYVSADVENATMVVRPAELFGKGLEVICRRRAVGSFLKRYGDYCEDGQELDYFVEVTLKDNDREDPPISKDALDMLGILTADEYEVLKDLTKQITKIVEAELSKKGLDLYDIKFEFGRIDGQVALVDEISGGNMRVYKDGEYIEPLRLPGLLFD